MTDKKDMAKMKDDLKELESKIQEKNDELQEKEEEIIQKDQEIEKYKEQLLRLQADFENFKKHTEKQLNDQIHYANEKLILKIIDSYEDLERALKSGKSMISGRCKSQLPKPLKNPEGEGLEETCRSENSTHTYTNTHAESH
jgi:molecular chaperone GrpE